MHNYVVRVYRSRPGAVASVSGIIEDAESGQKESFNSFNELQTLLAHSIERGQLELPNLTAEVKKTDESVAVVA